MWVLKFLIKKESYPVNIKDDLADGFEELQIYKKLVTSSNKLSADI